MPRAMDEGQTLYAEISDFVGFEKAEHESPEDYKGRLVLEFSDMNEWPDDRYDRLPQHVKHWIYDATTEYKANRSRKRARPLPPLSGLDGPTRRRADLHTNTGKGRAKTGDDCLTRVIKELVVSPATDLNSLTALLKEKYGKEYSKAAVRYAMTAYQTVIRNIRGKPEVLTMPLPPVYDPLPSQQEQQNQHEQRVH